MPKRIAPRELFTNAHRKAITTACEKLWNGEPVDDPIHSPRPSWHPLKKVGNEALAALNAVDAMVVAYEQELSRLRRRATIRRRETKGGDE